MGVHQPQAQLALVGLDKGGRQLFFEPGELCCEPTNLGVKVFELLSVRCFQFGDIILSLENGRQPLERLCTPVA